MNSGRTKSWFFKLCNHLLHVATAVRENCVYRNDISQDAPFFNSRSKDFIANDLEVLNQKQIDVSFTLTSECFHYSNFKFFSSFAAEIVIL